MNYTPSKPLKYPVSKLQAKSVKLTPISKKRGVSSSLQKRKITSRHRIKETKREDQEVGDLNDDYQLQKPRVPSPCQYRE